VRRESAVEGGTTKGDVIRVFGRITLTRIARVSSSETMAL
jgi:hypothetical protein